MGVLHLTNMSCPPPLSAFEEKKLAKWLIERQKVWFSGSHVGDLFFKFSKKKKKEKTKKKNHDAVCGMDFYLCISLYRNWLLSLLINSSLCTFISVLYFGIWKYIAWCLYNILIWKYRARLMWKYMPMLVNSICNYFMWFVSKSFKHDVDFTCFSIVLFSLIISCLKCTRNSC